jgi:hypothetical protein
MLSGNWKVLQSKSVYGSRIVPGQVADKDNATRQVMEHTGEPKLLNHELSGHVAAYNSLNRRLTACLLLAKLTSLITLSK